MSHVHPNIQEEVIAILNSIKRNEKSMQITKGYLPTMSKPSRNHMMSLYKPSNFQLPSTTNILHCCNP